MEPSESRYSRLAPLGVKLRLELALSAIAFFSPREYRKNCTILGKTPDPKVIRPLGASAFCTYLRKTGVLDDPLRYAGRIRQLLERLAASGVLTEMGHGSNATLPKLYYCLKELTTLEKTGFFWLAPALGHDFLFRLAAPGIVHIIGENADGDAHGGTGMVFHPHHILTCAHVVSDMTVHQQQVFQGAQCTVDSQFAHRSKDVAVLRTVEALKPVAGLSFLSPAIAQGVVALGYPRIPFAREAVLTVQRGEVTSEAVTTFDGHRAFLFSAIARPGNSGGPIFSDDGHVVGIAMQTLSQEHQLSAFSPHYAGVPSHEIAEAIHELEIGVQLPFEDFS